MEAFGEGLRVVGEILIGVSVLLVHRRMMQDQKIDKGVIRDIRKEQMVGILGITCIVVGYLIALL